MEKDLLKINILAIGVAGFLTLLTGVVLYLFRDTVAKNVRFFLPVPPIAVAAYVFVFNLYNHYGGELPTNLGDTVRELTISAVTLGIVFCAFATISIILIHILKALL